ncbi:uncharacterized protein KGF55_000976 [Candida pseudojiufengensis]|uniref:uncharacterized protein n=1 Tax=Candida pseudojiufengensis TaxID=497109 RepID=UPI0022246329|nr:uncharacterized protein KGF55_000976 [Candida pseudojiufengensis]KAI5965614.1 hypothetical protein KGF55_000976 [Candida pseudojiufengensis]
MALRNKRKYNSKNKRVGYRNNIKEYLYSKEKREKKIYNEKYGESLAIRTGQIFSGTKSRSYSDIILVERIANQLTNAFGQHVAKYGSLSGCDMFSIAEHFFVGEALAWVKEYFKVANRYSQLQQINNVLDHVSQNDNIYFIGNEYRPDIFIEDFIARFKPIIHPYQMINITKTINERRL